jgi:hypothetical protein
MLIASLLVRIVPRPSPLPFHFEPFSTPEWSARWTSTSLPNYTGRWQLKRPRVPPLVDGEQMLFADSPGAYYGLSTLFARPFPLAHLALQFETRFRAPRVCGAAYIKLFHCDNFSPANLSNETHFALMFGPDFCDNFMDKVQFIVRTRDPQTGAYGESRLKRAPPIENDRLGHLYTLILSNRSFEIWVDADQIINGTLDADFESSVNPEFIDDYSTRRPRDWNDNEKLRVPDPRRRRPPPGWLLDVPPQIPDPAGTDLIVPNPACKSAPGCGPWAPPIVTRTRGPWRRPKIRNSHFAPPAIPDLPDVIGAGFELWIVTRDIGIGNVWIGDDERTVRRWNNVHFIPKHEKELLMEEGRTGDDEILRQTTSTPKPKPTNVEIKVAFAYFGRYLKAAVVEFAGRSPEVGIVIVGVVAIVPLGVWACGTGCGRAGRRDARGRRRKRKEAAKSD